MLALGKILHGKRTRREKIIKPNKITICGPRKLSAADTISLKRSEGMEKGIINSGYDTLPNGCPKRRPRNVFLMVLFFDAKDFEGRLKF